MRMELASSMAEKDVNVSGGTLPISTAASSSVPVAVVIERPFSSRIGSVNTTIDVV